MFSKVFVPVAVALAMCLQVSAHALVAPPIGVKGTPARSDVQRPSAASPCGSVNIAQAVAASTPVKAAADGTFTLTATNFNAYVFSMFFSPTRFFNPSFSDIFSGKDGSRQFTATLDTSGTGASFSGAVAISTNGQAVSILCSRSLVLLLTSLSGSHQRWIRADCCCIARRHKVCRSRRCLPCGKYHPSIS